MIKRFYIRRIELAKRIIILIVFLFFVYPFKINASLQFQYLDSITEDEEGNKLHFPSFVYVESFRNEVYVISQTRIIIYTKDLFPLFMLCRCDGVDTPQGLTVDADGNIYLTQGATKDDPRHKISVFNASLKWKKDIYFEGFEGAESFNPSRVAVSRDGNIFVSSSYFPGIVILNSQGKFIELFLIDDEGKKVKVDNVTFDETGRMFIVSEEEGHIYVYDENRNFLFKFGEKGGCTGKLSRPQAVAVDNRNGRMYVVDYMRHTVLVYDEDGKFLTEFGGLGWGEGWFQYPRDIEVDSEGRIFVADTFNDRIQVFEVKE